MVEYVQYHMHTATDDEKQAEYRALSVLRGATFTDCLRLNEIAPTIQVVTARGKTLTVRGSDIYDHHTWHTFLVATSQEGEHYHLSEHGEPLATSYQTWLLTQHTERYRAIASKEDLAWLGRVVLLAVTRHIMEQKYAAYTTRGLQTFADLRVAIEMGNILLLNTVMKDAARLIHHIVKKPDQMQQIMKLFFDELFGQMQQRPLLSESTISGLIPAGEEETSHE